MPEKNNKDSAMMYCSCDNCQGAGMYNHKFFWLRWILAIAIILMVFALGVKIGEFKGYFDNVGGGYNMFDRHGYMMYPNNYYYGVPKMMVPQTTVPSSSTSTSTSTTKK